MNGLKTAMTEDKAKLISVFLLASKNIVPETKNVSLKPFVTCFYAICAQNSV